MRLLSESELNALRDVAREARETTEALEGKPLAECEYNGVDYTIQQVESLFAIIDALKADNDVLRCALNDKGCDSAALLKLSRFLSKCGQRDRDPDCVEAAIHWIEDLVYEAGECL